MILPDQIYVKQCESLSHYYSEIVGQTFFAQYYANVPIILARYERKRVLHYDNPAKGDAQLLADALTSNDYKKKSLADSFKSLAWNHVRNATFRPSEGGTKAFYLNQLRRLSNPEFHMLYKVFAGRNKTVTINGLEIPVHRYMPANIKGNISDLAIAKCVPSHGNMSERTMYTNGDVLHFEHTGWNAYAADAATFLWSTLFSGNYFGPRYAEWATDADKHAERYARPKALSYENGVVTLRLNKARKQLIREYVRYYLRRVDFTPEMQGQISHAIAFRLLTAYDVTQMRPTDRQAIFALANYFTYNPNLLHEKLWHLLGVKSRQPKERKLAKFISSQYLSSLKHLF